MAAPPVDPRGPILVANITGRDGTTPALFVPNDRVREALNVDWFESSLARKRGGASSVSLTGGTAQTGVISSLFSFTPTFDQGGRELWSIDDAATPRFKRLVAGTSWADVTVGDAIATKPWEVSGVAFNGKFYLAYDTTGNRLHTWDPVTAAVRRCGIDVALPPTAANQGGGTYAATLRYYRIRWVEIRSTIVYRAGDLSTVISFTPSGAGASVRVTQPATGASDSETHWELYGSSDGFNYFRLAQVAVGVGSFFDDSTVPLSYSGVLAPDLGAFTTPPSAKYLAADDARVVMAGAWETARGNSMEPKANRFWWTSPLGSTDNGDDERISNTAAIKSYDDIDEDFTGIGGPINGALFMFSYGGVWKSIKSPQPDAPYITTRISGAQGSISHKAIVKGEDENGEACLYWLSPVGPVRYGGFGFQRCHEDIDDIWRTVNLSATTVVAHGVFHRDKHQIWWWVATGSSNEPDTKIVFDTHLGKVVDSTGTGTGKSVRGGWSKHDGSSAAARCSVMMSDTLGASMSRTTKPYIGRSTGTLIWKCDDGTTDGGAAFQSYILTKDYIPWGLGKRGSMPEEAVLCFGIQQSVSVQLDTYTDFTAVGVTSTIVMTPRDTETRRVQKFSGSLFANAASAQFKIGDSAAADASWNLDALIARWTDSGMV